MTEEATEASVVKEEMSNGDNPVVSDDVLQNMRRGLFGKSIPKEETTQVIDAQETSNGSADTDDPKKNGVFFEDREINDQRDVIDVEELDTERPEELIQEKPIPVVEEPVEEPIEIPIEVEAAAEVKQPEEIEITEVKDGAPINAEVIEADSVIVESPEKSEEPAEESVEVNVEQEAEQEIMVVEEEEEIHIEEIPEEEVEVEEPAQAQPEQEEAMDVDVETAEQGEPVLTEEDDHPDDPVTSNGTAVNGVDGGCPSPPPTPVNGAAEEVPAAEAEIEEEPKEEDAQQPEEEVPQSSQRARKAKEEEPPKTTPRGGRGRRVAQKEETEDVTEEVKTPNKRTKRGAKKDEEKTEEPVEEEAAADEPVEDTLVENKRTTRRGRGQTKEEAKEEAKVEEAPKRGRRGREKKEEEEPEAKEEKKDDEEEINVETEEKEEEPKSVKRNVRGKGRGVPKRGKHQAKVEETEQDEEKQEEEEEKKEEKPEEVEEITKPKRSTRRGRADSGSEKATEVKETPRRGGKRGQVNEEKKTEEEEQTGLEEEGIEETEEVSKSSRRSTRAKAAPPAKTPKGKKTEVKEEEHEDEEEKEETKEPTSKRALRTRGAKAEPSASVKSAKGRSRSQKKETKEESEEEMEEEIKEETKTPKGRGKKIKAKSDVIDPYDVDSQFDQHPDPLKNVVVSEGLFGSTKYGKIGSGKYTFTEKAAEERIGNLGDLLPKQVNRRSLADLTPGRKRAAFGSKGAKSAPPARKRRGADSDDEMDVDEPGSSKATPTSRKRKSSPATATPSKFAKLGLPSLNDDKQWIVDHPPDEHAPIEIGARVYAVFDKIYYPAIIIAERDGLGRYKVSFVEDKVVRDIPAQGIVPLRAVVADKECFYGDDGAIIVACPNAASASEWAKAIFTIQLLDSDGEVTGNDIKCPWSKLSLDMNDWKDYIHQKSIEATAVAADNIAVHSRTRRSHAEAQKAATPKTITKISPKLAKSGKREGRTNKKDDEDQGADVEDRSAEEEEQLDCFNGMVFLLTSAQRDGNSNFKKKLLMDCIIERKGQVVEDFNDLETFAERRPFLISDTYYRTHKYLSALAKGVPCVSHEWIHKCVELETAVDYTEFVLPAGTSSIDGKLFPAPTNQSTLLAGKNVLIYSGNNLHNPRALNYYNIWAPLVSYMSGHPIRALNDLSRSDRIHIIISDNSVTDAMLDRAEQDGSWVVTSEWLIHAIIMDQLTDPETFPRFKVARSLRICPPSDPE